MSFPGPTPHTGKDRWHRHIEYTPTTADEAASLAIRDIGRHHRGQLGAVSSLLLEVAEACYGVEEATGRIIEFIDDHQDYRYVDALESLFRHLIIQGYVVKRPGSTSFVTRRHGGVHSVVLLTLTAAGASLIAYELDQSQRPSASG
jgi:hypothetical protein